MRDIGKNIKTLRIRRGMTQDELAEALYVTRQTVSNYETGRSRPDVEMLLRIAEVLQADVHHLLYGPPVPVDRRKELRQFLICAGTVALLWTGRLALRYWAMGFLQEHNGSVICEMPLYLLDYGVRPATILLFGWTFMQGLSLRFHLHRFPRPWAVLVRRAIIAVLAVNWLVLWCLLCYNAVMVYQVGMDPQNVLEVMSLPWRLARFTLEIIGQRFFLALMGGMLWYFGFPAKRKQKPAPVPD